MKDCKEKMKKNCVQHKSESAKDECIKKQYAQMEQLCPNAYKHALEIAKLTRECFTLMEKSCPQKKFLEGKVKDYVGYANCWKKNISKIPPKCHEFFPFE